MKTKLLFLTLLLSGFAANGMEMDGLRHRLPDGTYEVMPGQQAMTPLNLPQKLALTSVATVIMAPAVQGAFNTNCPGQELAARVTVGTMLAGAACCMGGAVVAGLCYQVPRADEYRVDRRD